MKKNKRSNSKRGNKNNIGPSYRLIRDVLKDNRINLLTKKIVKVYNTIPETTGCLENINKDGGCNGWCCRIQCPQVLYCEFLNTWKYILRFWDTNDVMDIVEKSLKNYLTDSITKGCIFFDREKKICHQHLTRPYNCRVYGIVPPEEFNPKMNKLKQEYANNLEVILKDQCSLISTKDGRNLSIKDTDSWWKKLIKIEKEIVPEENINDDADGSYRTFHDHVLLHIFHPQTLMDLTQVRLHGDISNKAGAIEFLMKELKQHILNQMKDRENGTGHECGHGQCSKTGHEGECKCSPPGES